MHRLWASIDQLYDLVRTQAHEANKFAGDLVPPAPRASWDGEGVESYALAFYGACGVLDGEPFPAFRAAAARNRYGGNVHLQGEVSKLMPTMVMGGIGATGGMGYQVQGTVASRFDAVVAGLVAAKLADNPTEGAYLVCEAFGRHGVRKCNTEEVVELLRAAHRRGVELLEGQVFVLMAETADWRQALTVCGRTRHGRAHQQGSGGGLGCGRQGGVAPAGAVRGRRGAMARLSDADGCGECGERVRSAHCGAFDG